MFCLATKRSSETRDDEKTVLRSRRNEVVSASTTETPDGPAATVPATTAIVPIPADRNGARVPAASRRRSERVIGSNKVSLPTPQRTRNALKPTDHFELKMATLAIQAAISDMQEMRRRAPNNRLPLGYRQGLVKKIQAKFPWVTEDILSGQDTFLRNKRRREDESTHDAATASITVSPDGVTASVAAAIPAPISETAESTASVPKGVQMATAPSSAIRNSVTADALLPPKRKRKKGGRPKGSTAAAKLEHSNNEQAATDRATILYSEEKKAYEAQGIKLPYRTMTRVIEQAKSEFHVPTLFIPPNTIRSRIKRGDLTPTMGPGSPMKEVEPILVELLKRLNRMNAPIDYQQALLFANSLIKGTLTQQKVLDFVKRNCGVDDAVVDHQLGPGYWKGFCKRHEKEIGKNTALVAKQKYSQNLAVVYQSVYDEMVRDGVARKLDAPVWVNKDGDIADKKDLIIEGGYELGVKGSVHLQSRVL